MGAIIVFGTSLVAIIGLLALKDWELRHRTKLFFVFRARLNATITAIASSIGTKAPYIANSAVSRTKRVVRHSLAQSLHRGLVRLEQLLERTLRTLRYQRLKTGHTASVSPFLRDVAEHKRTLDRSNGKETTETQD